MPEDRRRAPVLSDAEAAELAAYGSRIENHYGAPQDIEWARADGQFFIVQARPITALPEVEAPTANGLDRARTHRDVRPGQHRRATARPALHRCSRT